MYDSFLGVFLHVPEIFGWVPIFFLGHALVFWGVNERGKWSAFKAPHILYLPICFACLLRGKRRKQEHMLLSPVWRTSHPIFPVFLLHKNGGHVMLKFESYFDHLSFKTSGMEALGWTVIRTLFVRLSSPWLI